MREKIIQKRENKERKKREKKREKKERERERKERKRNQHQLISLQKTTEHWKQKQSIVPPIVSLKWKKELSLFSLLSLSFKKNYWKKKFFTLSFSLFEPFFFSLLSLFQKYSSFSFFFLKKKPEIWLVFSLLSLSSSSNQ